MKLHGIATFALGSGLSLFRTLALLDWHFRKREQSCGILVMRVMRQAEVSVIAGLYMTTIASRDPVVEGEGLYLDEVNQS